MHGHSNIKFNQVMLQIFRRLYRVNKNSPVQDGCCNVPGLENSHTEKVYAVT